jgi:hypothetical protein
MLFGGGMVIGQETPGPLRLIGQAVTPHTQSREMRWRREADFSLGARVELFLFNTGLTEFQLKPEAPLRVRGETPARLLAKDEWAWHDLPSAWTNQPLVLPPGALTVWSFNSKRAAWGVGSSAPLEVDGTRIPAELAEPRAWLSAVTFLGDTHSAYPENLIFHVVNHTGGSLRIEACRLWLPRDNASFRVLLPQPWLTNLATFPADGIASAGDRCGARVRTGRLPLTYTALEVRLADPRGEPLTLWAHLRIKRESFDISGGWVGGQLANGLSALRCEPFLKTLRGLHVNTAHIADTPGYTDETGPDGLYTRYPLKYFNRLEPFSQYDTDALLPRIHAVEFLGEPQYGGGKPVPPMQVWRALAPYQTTRMPTTVTHSEEREWRFYAGLSDYPHYDAYRVTAPSADSWTKYDRWPSGSLGWGAPLETIGEMTRSLRELNRPRSIAYWSQGAHEGWERYGGRKRTSPTPDELRLQAYFALANRITSLYWFNLSLKSLVMFPDLIEPIARVDREIRMLDDYYLEGDAASHETISRDGKPDWDLDVVAGPRGALLFALDLDYQPNPAEKIFIFGPPRDVTLRFRLPAYAQHPQEVFRVDADGPVTVEHSMTDGMLTIRDRISRVGIYVAAAKMGERERLETRRQSLVAAEKALAFDPAHNPDDFNELSKLLTPSTR